MTRLRLTLSLSGLGIGLVGVLQKNDYLVWIAIALLTASVLLRLVAAIRARAARQRQPTDPEA